MHNMKADLQHVETVLRNMVDVVAGAVGSAPVYMVELGMDMDEETGAEDFYITTQTERGEMIRGAATLEQAVLMLLDYIHKMRS